jgi:hypothetical protein
MESASTSTAGSTARFRLALRRSRRLRWVLAGMVALVAGFIVLAIVLLQPASTATPPPYEQTALRYAHTQIIWSKGPSVQSSRILPLRRLAAALRTSVTPGVARVVNVPDLLHRFGPNQRVALVVLFGSFNSLPPDEGVVIASQVVVLVQMPQNRAIYLNY